MDMDAEAVRDAENNINTVRWAGLITVSFTLYKEDTSKVIRVRCFSFSLVAYVSRPDLRVQEANCRLGPEGCTTEQV